MDPLTSAIQAAQAQLESNEDSTEVEDAGALVPDETAEVEQTDEDIEDVEDVEEVDDADIDDEDDEDLEDEDEDADEGDALPVDEDADYVLPDGTKVSGKELRNGYLRQADYTRKTQEAAREREQVQDVYDKMAAWYEQRASNPAAWIAEIASETQDPGKALAEAVGQSGNPTTALASVIRSLVEDGKLADEFVERLGLQKIAEQAKQTAGEDRVERLERQIKEREEREAAAQQQAQILAHYEQQWESIVEDEGLDFATPTEEADAKIELMKFARENEITNLVTAWSAMSYRRSRQQQEQPEQRPTRTRKRAKEAVERKRKAGAIQRQSNASGTSGKPVKKDLDSAVAAAFEKLNI